MNSLWKAALIGLICGVLAAGLTKNVEAADPTKQYRVDLYEYDAACTINQITTFVCVPNGSIQTKIYANDRDACEVLSRSSLIKELIEAHFSGVWVVPHCVELEGI